MTRSISNRIACLALTLAAMSAPMALAQDFSPYFETTGRGAYDLYNEYRPLQRGAGAGA